MPQQHVSGRAACSPRRLPEDDPVTVDPFVSNGCRLVAVPFVVLAKTVTVSSLGLLRVRLNVSASPSLAEVPLIVIVGRLSSFWIVPVAGLPEMPLAFTGPPMPSVKV